MVSGEMARRAGCFSRCFLHRSVKHVFNFYFLYITCCSGQWGKLTISSAILLIVSSFVSRSSGVLKRRQSANKAFMSKIRISQHTRTRSPEWSRPRQAQWAPDPSHRRHHRPELRQTSRRKKARQTSSPRWPVRRSGGIRGPNALPVSP